MENLRFRYYYIILYYIILYYIIGLFFSFNTVFFISKLYLFIKYLLNGYISQIQKLVISVLSLNAFYKKNIIYGGFSL